MLLNDEDKTLTKNSHQFKERDSRMILTKFSGKNGKGNDWTLSRKKYSWNRRHRPKARKRQTEARVLKTTCPTVDELWCLLCKEDETQTHRSTSGYSDRPVWHRL